MENSAKIENIIKKYCTNDDVGGGLPKILDLFFHKTMAQEFRELKDSDLKRRYLELFNLIDQCMSELCKCVEMYKTLESNAELTNLAEERLEERTALIA
jgi:hypothetical protein